METSIKVQCFNNLDFPNAMFNEKTLNKTTKY